MANRNQKDPDSFNHTKPFDQKEKSGVSKEKDEGRREEKDFWNRISEDPAEGYKTKEDPGKLLNVDQKSGDDELGD